MTRWHCLACAPCLDADDAVFDWHLEVGAPGSAAAPGSVVTTPIAVAMCLPAGIGHWDAEGFYVYGADEHEPGQEG